MRAAHEGGEAPAAVTCPWADCWCKAWPMIRLIPSIGVRYTVEELEPEGRVRRFRYVYL